MKGETYILVIQDVRHGRQAVAPPLARLRQIVHSMLRAFGFRCVIVADGNEMSSRSVGQIIKAAGKGSNHGVLTQSEGVTAMHAPDGGRTPVQSLGEMGRSAGAVQHPRGQTPPRAAAIDAGPILEPAAGERAALHVRGVRMAAPAGQRAVSVARSTAAATDNAGGDADRNAGAKTSPVTGGPR